MADPLVAAGQLARVLPEWELSTSPIQLVWLPGADRAPALRALIDFLSSEL